MQREQCGPPQPERQEIRRTTNMQATPQARESEGSLSPSLAYLCRYHRVTLDGTAAVQGHVLVRNREDLYENVVRESVYGRKSCRFNAVSFDTSFYNIQLSEKLGLLGFQNSLRLSELGKSTMLCVITCHYLQTKLVVRPRVYTLVTCKAAFEAAGKAKALTASLVPLRRGRGESCVSACATKFRLYLTAGVPRSHLKISLLATMSTASFSITMSAVGEATPQAKLTRLTGYIIFRKNIVLVAECR